MPAKTGSKQEIPRNPDGTFPKGVSGNPNGKLPGTRHMTTKIMEAIVRVSDGGNEPEDVQLVKTLLSKAKEGDMQAMKLIFNYVDGMPPQALELSGTGENGAINVNIKMV